jgi:excisionase family DNA binding protein
MPDRAGIDMLRLTELREGAAVMREGPPLTVKEAAERARVSIKTIRRAYTEGHLPFYRPRGSQIILILDVDVDDWALQPGVPRRPRPVPALSATASRPRRAPITRSESRSRPEAGSRDDLRAIERDVR